ncbi:MAG TPA: hypothetical protein VHN98_12465 [Acidimicrobiales bacterium]|nr:hypothetical protein [Acidimicrobiales bacterium]
MGGLGDITFGQIGAALGRYKPVVVTVVALVAMLTLLPRHSSPTRTEDASAVSASKVSPGIRPATKAPTTSAAASSTTAADASAITSAPVGGTLGASTAPALASALSTPPSPSSYDTPTASQPSGGYSSPISDSTSTSGGAAMSSPLHVRESAWSTQEAGTPLAADGVPDGTLPVGTRVGRDDKRSFVRLSGGDTVLRLTEDPSGSRATAGVAAVQACQVTTAAWSAKTAVAMSSPDEPTWDANTCVAGTRASDGTWTFDLSAFASPTDARGIALVPAPGGPIDAQVTFKAA